MGGARIAAVDVGTTKRCRDDGGELIKAVSEFDTEDDSMLYRIRRSTF
jgi:hypothetical protein